MRSPDFDEDGWCLDDAEERHQAASSTFWIPDRNARENLQKGDLAKLIFRISVDDPKEPVAIERMWVLIRERIQNGYIGILESDPYALAENDELWSGVELPFQAHHVIDIQERDEKSIILASQEPKRHWPKE